jgi:hypothetical protein
MVKNNSLAFVMDVFLQLGTFPILVHVSIPKTRSPVKIGQM